MISATSSVLLLSPRLTFWVAIVAGIMLAVLMAVMLLLTLAPRVSDTWAERLGENTDREKAVDYRDAIVDETQQSAKPADEPEAELEEPSGDDDPVVEDETAEMDADEPTPNGDPAA